MFATLYAIRGIPKLINSDNTKTFKTGNKIIGKILRQPSVKVYLGERKISWRFNLSRSSWFGGHYEPFVKEIKRCLRKTFVVILIL